MSNISCCVILNISEKFKPVGLWAEFTGLNFSEILKFILLEPNCCINLLGGLKQQKLIVLK